MIEASILFSDQRGNGLAHLDPGGGGSLAELQHRIAGTSGLELSQRDTGHLFLNDSNSISLLSLFMACTSVRSY